MWLLFCSIMLLGSVVGLAVISDVGCCGGSVGCWSGKSDVFYVCINLLIIQAEIWIHDIYCLYI